MYQASPARVISNGLIEQPIVGSDGLISSNPFRPLSRLPTLGLVTRRRREPQAKLAVEDVARDLVRVLVKAAAVAGVEVDKVEVMPARIAVVHGDGDEARVLVMEAR